MKTEANKDQAIITVVGQDRPGIIAGITTLLAGHAINVLDINQTIFHEPLFNMIMLVDLAACTQSFDKLQQELEQLGRQLGVDIRMQLTAVYEAMNRI